MLTKLRRNTIMQDWHNSLENFYKTTGYSAWHIVMNKKTLQYMIEYLTKNPQYGCLEIQHNYVDVRDVYKTVTVPFLNSIDIEFCGVEIMIDDCLENEVIRVW